MKRVARLMVGMCLVGMFSSGANPKYGPAGKPEATPLSRDHGYFQSASHAALDFWAMAPFYVPQLNEFSCSVASVAAVVNAAARAGKDLPGTDTNATHASLLDTVKVAEWASRMQKGGFHGEVGLTLDQLAKVVAEALRVNGIKNPRVEKVEVRADDKAARARWRETIAKNEASGRDLLLIHFTQDTLTKSQGGPYPHISPIGAYDPETGRVLVMDVDRTYYEPYWVGADLVVTAMAVKTPPFGHGGWVRVSY
jgi:hypothetical protein